jgi:predicted nucleic acid-binding protein
MDYVYDTSFVIASIVPDEGDLWLKKLHAGLEPSTKKYTPQVIWYEITNVFMNMIRSKRFVYEEFSHFFTILKAFGLTTDYESGISYSQKLLRLCNQYNITSYDAAYLELAERKNAVLCTFDEDLINAAKKHGVSVIREVK